MMTNLYEETVEILKEHRKTFNDVRFVKGENFLIDKDEFIKIAKNTTYDNGFGWSEIALDLVIMGDNWWLERKEYDGSEWWEFKRIPSVLGLKYRKITTVCNRYSEDRFSCFLDEMNEEVV